MIINEQVKDMIVLGERVSKKASISGDKLAKLQYLLTKGLYKDPITAVIAEWTNNGIDSVVQAGKNPIKSPVIVNIYKDNNSQSFFSVEDEGVGLDDDDFENICMNYLESTKEEDNDTIGHFGIGMKSFLSLERPATFICRKDSIERKYLVYEGEEFVNYDLIYERPTKEKNGVKAEIQIKDWSERSSFIIKAKQKLCYYDTAVLIVDRHITENQIYRANDFQYSIINNSSTLHLCLKDVYYPIDWDALGIKPINLPLAIRINLEDGLIPTPSRESYITNDKTKKLLLEKISKIANFLVNKYNDNLATFPDFISAYQYIGVNKYIIKINNIHIEINPIILFSTIKVKEVIIPNLKLDLLKYKSQIHRFFTKYSIVCYKDNSGVMRTPGRRFWRTMVQQILENKKVVIIKGVFTGNIKEYLKDAYPNETLFIKDNGFKRIVGTDYSDQDYDCYKAILNLDKIHNKLWSNYVSEWEMVQKSIVDTFIDETNVINTVKFEQWLVAKKATQKALKAAGQHNSTYQGIDKQVGDVTLAYSYKSLRGISFKKVAYPIVNLIKNQYLTVLITDDDNFDDKFIKDLVAMHVGNHIKFAKVGKLEIKKIPKHHQFIKLTEYMNNRSKPFMRLASAIIFKKVLKEFQTIRNFKQGVFREFADTLLVDKTILDNYVQKNYQHVDDIVSAAIIDIAEEKQLFDLQIWDTYLNFKKNLDKYDFINILAEPNIYDSDTVKKYDKVISQILLFRKKYYNEELDKVTIIFNNK